MNTRPRFRILTYVLSVTVLVTVTALLYHLYSSRPKIAYVRSLELVYSYNGMKEANAEYRAQTQIWQANIDTLKINYDRKLAQFESEINSLDEKEKKEKSLALAKMKDELINYSNVLKDQAAEKEKKMTQAVLNQINSYVSTYAKSKGYDMVFGADGNGSLVYGTNTYDITEDVLRELNKEHKDLSPISSIDQLSLNNK